MSEATPQKADMETLRLEARFSELLGESGDLYALSGKLAGIPKDPDIDALRAALCNQLLYAYCAGYAKYPVTDANEDLKAKQVFNFNADLLPQTSENRYFLAVSCFFRRDHDGCIRNLKAFLEYNRAYCENQPLDESTWADFLLDTFKNAWRGFWPRVAELLKDYPCDSAVVDLCGLIDAYYQCKTDDEMIDLLLPFAATHPALSLPKELLGFSYLGKRMWNNALACFTQVEGKSVLFYYADIAFQIAWCQGKLRHHRAEELAYRNCLEQEPGYANALNNLGYCLYKQKKYAEAITVFEQCLAEKRDLPFAANNYVRALLASGQYKTAQEFIARGRFKVSADLVKRTQQHKPVNEAAAQPAELPEEDEDAEKAPPDFGIKRQQFSSEKILEDELTARIEAGQTVFGQRLRIYQRAGDFYGRQYPIANGKWRLDLLCEDADENLVVIELKKDSGYDNPYEQTKNYVEWLQAHRCQKGQKVTGIICLNAPSAALVAKVQRDARIRLFEYQISYREIR